MEYKVYCEECGHEMEYEETLEYIDDDSYLMTEWYCPNCDGITPRNTKKRRREYE